MLGRLLLSAILPLAYVLGVSPSKPHLFFVLVDDLGFNDFSYRSSDLESVAWPHVNALLNQSIKIEHYYTQPLCTPTRAALMTGRYPARLGLQHGVIAGNYDYGLPLDEVTLADKLKAAGYATHAVGKWHLGDYNFESTPTYRGFDTYMGYWSGGEDYYTHVVGNALDFHRQWNVSGDGHGTYQSVNDQNNVFSTQVFGAEMARAVETHKKQFPSKPGFFYLPLQNVHSPLESPGGEFDEACKDIPNADRKIFCAMAAAADQAIGNLTSQIETLFAGEDYLMVISGDNGGIPMSAGNNYPLRGMKAELWEGGVRNNAIVWGSLVPQDRQGSTYTNGMIHVTDWHATFASLGGSTLESRKAMDGKDVWPAISSDQASPMSEFLINYDPCSGHGSCAGVQWGYREGDMKLMYGVRADTWYPVPTTSTNMQSSTGVSIDEASGSVWWPEEHYQSSQPSSSTNSTSTLSEQCVKAVKQSCPSGTILCSSCINSHWSTISKGCSRAAESTVADYMCYGITAWLFNVTADPYEQNNLLDRDPTNYQDTVLRMQGKVDAIVNGDDYLAPPNVPGGSCASPDPDAAAVIAAHGELYPWVNGSSLEQ